MSESEFTNNDGYTNLNVSPSSPSAWLHKRIQILPTF